MYWVRYGGRKGRRYPLTLTKDLIVVRTREPAALENAVTSRKSLGMIHAMETTAQFMHAGVSILRPRVGAAAARLPDAHGLLKKERGIRFSGRGLCDPKSKRPVVYTENFFVKFAAQTSATKCKRILKDSGLTVKYEIAYSPNAYFAAAREGTGRRVFDIASVLLKNPLVELCHPELIRAARKKVAFPRQWHLKKVKINGRLVNAHANVEAAWKWSTGTGIVIAVIDDGVDTDHEEFAGKQKILFPRDVTRKLDEARPIYDGRDGDHHGTAYAGVACANGTHGASGVAPEARLMPIRFASGLGSQQEAEAFAWAADHGADVISCSWGPEDGDPEDPDDAMHEQVVALPDSTRLAMAYAVTNGRGGKGCVICFAAGNGNESVDNDGYAGSQDVIAVAACNDRGRRSFYSDFGDAVWCSFPSNDFGPPEPLTPGIWTTDRSGDAGYTPHFSGGDASGNYTDSFGGTSSACPGVAGVVALMLSRHPNLTWKEVKDRLKKACVKVDKAHGGYDGDGHSPKYGHGRVDALKAVRQAGK